MKSRHGRLWMRLAIFAAISCVAFGIIVFGYIRLPQNMFGVGRYTITIELPDAAGLYPRGNVTYRGIEVGKVTSVYLTSTGVAAELSLQSAQTIPSALTAEVHSQTAIGEQYIQLIPRDGTSVPLKAGDVITREHTTVPPDISELLDATNRGLQAIPHQNLKTVVDESFTAVGGLGPDLSRLVKGSTALAIDSHKNLDSLTSVIDNFSPVIDTQADTAGAVQAWAAHLADITQQLKSKDGDVQGILQKAGPALGEGRALFERLQPTLPLLLANLVSINQVAITYRDNIEQLLVILPQGAANIQGILIANKDTKVDYKGAYLSFNLNINLPPPCTTGFLPAQQVRSPALVDFPDHPRGTTYCQVPQDSMFNVRGARNIPCETQPGKRAPTAKVCESDEPYVPLNDGLNWKGDPNATLTGQSVPQLPPGTSPAAQVQPSPPPAGPTPPAAVAGPAPPPGVAFAYYDPATGTYTGPDGRQYTQSDLARDGAPPTWQNLLLPPKGQ